VRKDLVGPITAEDIADLRIGDYVYYTGIIATGRDDVHHRVVHQGMDLPVDLNGLALFHAGPIIRETPEKNEMVGVGPTSSIRMEEEEAEFIAKTGVKLLVGKGAMGEKTARACKDLKAIHCVFPGGCAVQAGACVEEVTDVKWRELGMPECIWVMKVKDFGPLIVSIDTEGNNLFVENRKHFEAQREPCLAPIKEKLKTYLG